MSAKLGRFALRSGSSLLKKTIRPGPRLVFNHLQSTSAAPSVNKTLPTSTSLATSSSVKAWLDESKRRLVLDTGDSQHEYPWVWLRDNCQCHECFEPISQVRFVVDSTLGLLNPTSGGLRRGKEVEGGGQFDPPYLKALKSHSKVTK